MNEKKVKSPFPDPEDYPKEFLESIPLLEVRTWARKHGYRESSREGLFYTPSASRCFYVPWSLDDPLDYVALMSALHIIGDQPECPDEWKAPTALQNDAE